MLNKPEVRSAVLRAWSKNCKRLGAPVSNRIRDCRKELSKWKISSKANSKQVLEQHQELGKHLEEVDEAAEDVVDAVEEAHTMQEEA